jgi:hypothetical protein
MIPNYKILEQRASSPPAGGQPAGEKVHQFRRGAQLSSFITYFLLVRKYQNSHSSDEERKTLPFDSGVSGFACVSVSHKHLVTLSLNILEICARLWVGCPP